MNYSGQAPERVNVSRGLGMVTASLLLAFVGCTTTAPDEAEGKADVQAASLDTEPSPSEKDSTADASTRAQRPTPPPNWTEALDIGEEGSPLAGPLASALRAAQHAHGDRPVFLDDVHRTDATLDALPGMVADLSTLGIEVPERLLHIIDVLQLGLREFAACDVPLTAADQLRLIASLDHLVAYALVEYASMLRALGGQGPNSRLGQAGLLLARAADEPLESLLASLEPHHPYYHRLRGAHARYHALAASDGFIPVDRKVLRLRPGRSSPMIEQLRARLAQEDSGDVGEGPEWDEPLTEALRRARHAYRLRTFRSPSRQLDKRLLKALAVPAQERLASIEANLRRWLTSPVRYADYLVLVNLPDFHGEVWDQSERLSRFRVVIGKSGRRKSRMINATPTLDSKIHTIVYNPWWTVPKRIIQEELVVKAQAFERKQMALKANAAEAVPEESPDYWQTHDYVVKGDMSKPKTLRVRRKPGPGNALGKVKFVFENRWAVFLHDTPQKGKFRHGRRAFSHGCVRVHKPLDLAELLIRRDGGWERVKKARVMRHYKPTYIKLSQPVDVVLAYFTAQVEDDGRVAFFNDVYRRDSEVIAAR